MSRRFVGATQGPFGSEAPRARFSVVDDDLDRTLADSYARARRAREERGDAPDVQPGAEGWYALVKTDEGLRRLPVEKWIPDQSDEDKVFDAVVLDRDETQATLRALLTSADAVEMLALYHPELNPEP